jgi:hypothetical protein
VAAVVVAAEDGSRGLTGSMAKTSSSSGGVRAESWTEAASSSVLMGGTSPQSEGAVGEGDMVSASSSSVEVEGGLKGARKAADEATLCSRSEPRTEWWWLMGVHTAEAAGGGTAVAGGMYCQPLRGVGMCCLRSASRMGGQWTGTGMNSCLIECESD